MIDLEQVVKDKLVNHPDRLKHIKGVVQVSIELAKIYQVNEADASIAALFHDFTKYDSIKSQMKYLSNDIINKYQDYQFVYHAYSAANALKSLKPDINNEVLEAIKHHIWCRPKATKLEKIIYLADKSEPSRKYPSARKIYEFAKINLDQAVMYSLEANLQYLKSKNIVPHPEQIETLRYYQEKKEPL